MMPADGGGDSLALNPDLKLEEPKEKPLPLPSNTFIDMNVPFLMRDDPFLLTSNDRTSRKWWDWNSSSTLKMYIPRRKRPISAGNGSIPPVPVVVESVPEPNESMNGNGINFGGCPLECPFDPNENFDDALKVILRENTFPGIKLPSKDLEIPTYGWAMSYLTKAFARPKNDEIGDNKNGNEFSSKVKMEDMDMDKYYIPLIPESCQGQTALIGIGKRADGPVQVFSTLRILGPFQVEAPEMTMREFYRHHQELAEHERKLGTCQVQAIYEGIHGGESVSNAKVFIEFLWSDPKELFELPPPEAQMRLVVQPKPGDANIHLKDLWSEVEVLTTFLGWRESGRLERDMPRPHMFTTNAGDSTWVDEATRELLSKDSVPIWETKSECSNSIADVLEKIVSNGRSDIDFTDHMWRVFKKCSTPNDILESFRIIFCAVENKSHRPYLLPTNKTLFGEFLRDLLSEKIKNFRPILSQARAVEMAVDIGINKLLMDYTYVLKMCRLVDPKLLAQFEHKFREYRVSVENVKKLHCLMEVLCLCKDRLAFSMLEQESQTSQLLLYFEKHNIEWSHTICLEVSPNAVETLISGVHPIGWNIRFQDKRYFTTVTTKVVITRDILLDHAYKYTTGSETGSPGYYVYVNQEKTCQFCPRIV